MINAIFAVDSRGGLGYKGALPWPHNAEDMAHFKTTTQRQVVVMGRKTFESVGMPKPLPGRINYVVTNRPISIKGVHTLNGDYVSKIVELQTIHPDKEIFIIGGSAILMKTRPILDRIYLTYIKGSYRIDTSIHMTEFLSGFRARSCDPKATCTMMTFTNENKR